MNSNFNEENPPENKEKIINTKAKNDSQSINESVQIIIDESYKNKSLNLNPVKKKEKEKTKEKMICTKIKNFLMIKQYILLIN